jgi:hypothetical protein
MSEQQTSVQGEPRSIWFFVGLILSVYGVIVLLMGLFGTQANTVLAETRPAIWWGAIMAVFGIIFLYVGRRADSAAEEDA